MGGARENWPLDPTPYWRPPMADVLQRSRLPKEAPSRGWDEPWAICRGHRRIAGLDEAGRGPWAGPVVAAAVVLRERRFAVRIDDSKLLTPVQRERAYAAIRKQGEIGLGIVSHELIDRENILRATCRAMQEAIADLAQPPELLLVDGRIPSLTTLPQHNLLHGERHSLSIACASIVAKVTRDRLMRFYDRLFPAYGFAQHKGYGTSAHLQQLRALGPTPLHRVTFRPVAALCQ